MLSKKFIPVALILIGAGLFLAFQSQGKNENDDNPKSRYSKVLRTVGLLLEEGHYSPKKIDDSFSKVVFKKFTEDLDDDKNVFLQSDIDSLSALYGTAIDDEIHGSELKSFFGINDLYNKRRDESFTLMNSFLMKPFDFTVDESIQQNREKLRFPATEQERKELWRKTIKFYVLSRFVELQQEMEKNKLKKDFVLKADSTLEREARDYVKKRMGRMMTTKKLHENVEENFSVFVNAITLSMDPHTDYFPPVDKRSFDESMSGKFYGIGALLKDDEGKIKISSLIPGMPAARNGDIKVNDEIIKIGEGNAEPVDVTGYATSDAVKLIRGAEKGSEVRLTIKKIDGTTKIVSLKRDEIKLEDTFAKSAIINGEHKLGYIWLPEFYQDFQNPNGARCSNDVAKEIEKLKIENVEGIILDLRDNGGGSLSEVVKMAGLFIEDGPICQVKDREQKTVVLRDKDRNILYTGPLTVMVNEFSASASEIFAAAIQDYKRGIIVGSSSTYGKGTVQRSIPLNPEAENPVFASKEEDLGALKLTLQKFYRINGGATQLKGVVPDIVLPDRMEYLKFREKDNTAALPWDEIAKVDYKPWVSNVSNDSVINITYNQINKSSVFSKIKTDFSWLNSNSENEIPLNILKYKQNEKLIKDTYKQLDELNKLPKELIVKNVAADTVKINIAKDNIDKNKLWLKRLSGDIYIDETVKVLDNMILQKSMAKLK